MKVKIKGLVFVGFAAAVFVQSAMATPSEPARRVASKEYVDTYAQEQAKRVTTTNISTIATGLSQTDPWEHDDMYPSMKVLKGVKDELGVASTINGDAQHYTQKIAVFQGGYTPTGSAESPSTADLAHVVSWKIVVPDSVVADDGAGVDSEMIAANDSHLTTVSAVRQYAETLTNKAEAITTTTGGNYDSTDEYASTKAVYDYAQPKVSDTSGALQVGYRGQSGDATWKTIQASGAQTSNAATTNYVTMTEGTGASAGVYSINLSSSQIATTGTGSGNDMSSAAPAAANADQNAQDAAAANRAKLATAGAVYDFVTSYGDGAYQPHVTGTGAKVGTLNTTGGVDSYDWETIQASGGQTSNAASTSYLTMTHSGTTYEVNLTSDQIASAGSTIAGANLAANSNDVDNVKLATALAVKDYMNGFGLGDAADTLPSECRTANGNTVCSLIAYYDDQQNKVVYKWEATVPSPATAYTPAQGG